MKKKTSFITLVLAGIMMLSGCSLGKTEMSYYDECTYEEGSEQATINENLFYTNELVINKTVRGADPAVMQITDKDDPDYGKFVLTLTSGSYSFTGYISSDLSHWEPLGMLLQADDDNNSDLSKVLYKNTWASEMVYDDEEGKYYLFFSAVPRNDSKITGLPNDSGSSTNRVFDETYRNLPYVAVSDSFRGPFELIDHSATYRYPDGTPMMAEDGTEITKSPAAPIDHVEIKDNAQGYSYFLKYTLFDPYQIWQAILNSDDPYVREIADYEPIPFLLSIDYHPFTDRNGNKYLYFTCNKDGPYSTNKNTYVMGIKMNSWTDPDYSTLSRLTRYGYYEVDDIADGSEKSTYENQTATINEGAWMNEHNGKYYLTFSANGYGSTFYKVVQAISDSPLGPFRKLTEEEGGVVLGADAIDSISGPGHHAMVEIDDKLYIVYHKHDDPLVGGTKRHVALTEIKWITIKDKFGNDLDVMYANGPTDTTVQLLPDFATGYTNVALKAKITATNLLEESKAENLIDGLIPVTTGLNAPFLYTYVKETEFSKETKITMTFDDYTTVKGIMIYNSQWIENAFYDVERIEFTYNDNGKERVKYIDNLAFDWDANTNQGFSMKPCGAAIAEFNEIEVKEIRITVKPATTEEVVMHDNSKEAQISMGEIVVIGKE